MITKHYLANIVAVAESLKMKGWTAYLRDSTEEKVGHGDCFSCKKDLVKVGILGFGLQYCSNCKVAIEVAPRDSSIKNRVVKKYWDGNLYSADIYELVERHFSDFQKIGEMSG